jgi:hypothetical protein
MVFNPRLGSRNFSIQSFLLEYNHLIHMPGVAASCKAVVDLGLQGMEEPVFLIPFRLAISALPNRPAQGFDASAPPSRGALHHGSAGYPLFNWEATFGHQLGLDLHGLPDIQTTCADPFQLFFRLSIWAPFTDDDRPGRKDMIWPTAFNLNWAILWLA